MATDETALAGHRFKKDGRLLFRQQHFAQRLRDIFDPLFRALLYMTAGVEIVAAPGDIFQPPDIFLHSVNGKAAEPFVRGAGVKRIRRVCERRQQAVFCGKLQIGRYVCLVKSLDGASARIACKKLEGVRTYFYGFFSHCKKAF